MVTYVSVDFLGIIRPWSLDFLDGRLTDTMKIPPIEK